MTNELSVEEAIELLKEKRMEINYQVNGTTQFSRALDMAIKALEKNIQPETCPITNGVCGYPIEDCCNCPNIKAVLDLANKTLEQQPKTGKWIEDAETYYKMLNERGLGVDEYTPYFTDDIACSVCLAKYSCIDNETQFFKYCPNCGADMRGESE